ncbi:MAG TPA: SulP family inorganic anion transporter [Longimicrobium sp.]
MEHARSYPQAVPLAAPALRLEPASAAPAADLSLAATWRADMLAGLVVFLVALPLCLGIALASGAPLMSGIITGVVGGLVVSRLSGSQLMVSGPAAGLTAIVLTAITTLGSWQVFLLALVLAGVLQMLLAVARAGAIGHFFPSSVIRGMLAAIGLTLIIKQLPYALGAGLAAKPGGGGALDAITSAAAAMKPGAVLLAAVSLALLALWDHPALARAKKIVPGPLFLVALGVAANAAFGWFVPAWAIPGEALVQLPALGGAAGWASVFTMPDWTAFANPAVWTVAVTLALVASLETLLSLEATDKMDPLKRRAPANRELMAQGAGNALCGLIGGLPMTGVIVRSSANVEAGGRTWRAAFIHGVFLAVAVIALAGVLNLIPLATLAAILIYTGFKLTRPSLVKQCASMGRAYFVPFAVTILAILATDLLVGIGIGLVAAALFLLYDSYATGVKFHHEEAADRPHLRLVLAEQVTFLNKARIHAVLHAAPEGSEVTVDARGSRRVDPDVVELIHEFKDNTAQTRNINLRLVGVPEAPASSNAH